MQEATGPGGVGRARRECWWTSGARARRLRSHAQHRDYAALSPKARSDQLTRRHSYNRLLSCVAEVEVRWRML